MFKFVLSSPLLFLVAFTTIGQPKFEPIPLVKNNFYTELLKQANIAPVISWVGIGRITNKEIHGLPTARFTQELILSNGKLYVFLGATGRLYQISDSENDDSIRLIRLDTTSLTGYNINCYAFSQGDSIFNIGGYGFWRWNGHLRLFNSKLKEWDIVPLNKELPIGIHSPNAFLWNDKKNKALYCLNYFIGNDGVRINENKKFAYVDSITRLDLTSGDWTTIGKMNPIFEKDRGRLNVVAQLDSGILLDNAGMLEYWNILSNTIKVFNNKTKQQQISTKTIHTYLWYVSPYLYHGSPSSGIVDSIKITHLDFRDINEPVYIKTSSILSWWWLLIVPAVGVVGWAIAQRRRKPGLKATGPALKFNLRSPSENLNLFDEVEKSLLHLLLKNMNEKGLRTDADQINRVIGVAGSTLNMQKRKRSDVIRSINTKYNNRFPDREHPLINREKSEQDARLFEYYISESNAQDLVSILPH